MYGKLQIPPVFLCGVELGAPH